MLLWLLMLIDWITGIIKSIKAKSFVSYKLYRMPIYFVATTLVLSLSWWMSKQSILFTFLPGLVIGGFYSTYFISLLVQRIEMMCQAVEAYIYSKKGVPIKINRIAIISDARHLAKGTSDHIPDAKSGELKCQFSMTKH